jgi:invasion protein IalB
MDAPRKRIFQTGISSLWIQAAAAAMASAVRVPLQSLGPTARRRLTSQRSYWRTNSHKPHQGKQECARRVRQMANRTHGY